MLKRMLLPMGGTLLLLQYVVQASNLTLARLESILDLAETCKKLPAAKEVFVEDLSHLVEGNSACRNKFFCKVQKIFHVHHRVCENNTLKEYLKQYNKNESCQKMLQRPSSVDVKVPMVALLKKLQHCVRLRISCYQPR